MKKIFQHTWSILSKKERRQYGRLIVMDMIISIVDILSLAMLLWIIQYYLQPGTSNLAYLRFAADRGEIWFIALFFILFSIKNTAAFLVAKAHYKFISKVALRISRNNLVNYQEGSYDDFVQTDSSVHTRKISYQPFEFCQYILTGVQQLTTQVCLISITILAILLFNAQLFLLLLAILLPPVVVVFYLIKKRLDRTRKIIQASNERSFQYLFDVLKGFVESNIYNRNDFFRNRFMKARQRFSNALFDSFAIQHMPARIIEIFAILGLFILIAVANWSGVNDAASLLTIGAFMAAAYKIIPGIVKIINVSGQMRSYAFALVDITLEEEGYDQERLQMALNISGLDTFISQNPDGLNTMIMENGKNISGGQQQRIAIARAIYKNADLLLLDEPFNELDENSENKILTHLKTLASQGKMVVLVTHNKKALNNCTKIISLDESI